jgi:S-adenosylmethionine hydrolase
VPAVHVAIFLFTDFGSGDLYVGQVKSVLHEYAPGNAVVIDLLHNAPAFNLRASAHLLAALVGRVPPESVVIAVVDPGVGGARRPVAMRADGRWYVGPDNGLMSVVAARAQAAQIFLITWRPRTLSASFHGRDLFAPFAGMLAGDARTADRMEAQDSLDVRLGGDDLAEVIYIDHYGNAMTGLRAGRVNRKQGIVAGERRLAYARVFADIEAGEACWYENSIGLIEIAANGTSASAKLGLRLGQPLAVD